MLSDPGDAYWYPADPISWCVASRSPLADPRLVACVREGGDALGWLAGSSPLTRWPFGSSEISPGRYTHLLYVYL